MRVLILDNNLDQNCWGSNDLKRFVTVNRAATAFVRRGPHGDVPTSARTFDRLIISGSRTSCMEEAPWITRLDELIRDFLSAGKPVLGVCYGHQSLNRALGGRTLLRRATTPEFGWSEIELLQNSPLFAGLPRKFFTYSSHYEEVHTLAPGMIHLARSAACEIQACQLGMQPVFGIQFHPERNLAEVDAALLARKKRGETEFLLRHDEGNRLFDPLVGERIFANFLQA